MPNGDARDAAQAAASTPSVPHAARGGFVARELRRVASLVPEAFHVVFPDGARFESRPGPAAFTLRFRNRRAQMLPALFGHIGLLDAYFDGDLDIDGDFRALCRVGMSGRFGGGAN